ncbi:hypothetical protein OROGR_023282 [Orobanche gracilis]
MAGSSPVEDILDYLRKNKFTKAEAALKSELGNKPDINGILQKLKLDGREPVSRSSEEGNGQKLPEINGPKLLEKDPKIKNNWHRGEGPEKSSSAEVSKELIVKEVECGTGTNGYERKWRSCGIVGDQSMVDASVGTSDKNNTICKSSDDTVLDLHSSKYSSCKAKASAPSFQNDSSNLNENKFSGLQVSGKAKFNLLEAHNSGKVDSKSGGDSFSGEERISWPVSISKAASVELKHERSEKRELKVVDRQKRPSASCSKNEHADSMWSSRSNVSAYPSSELWMDASTSYDSAAIFDTKEGKRKTETNEIRSDIIKDQVDEVGRALDFRKTWGGELKDFGSLGFCLASDNEKEELPRLPPVRLKSVDNSFNIHWEEKYEREGPGPKILDATDTYLIGSLLDVPIGREINPSGKRPEGGSWLSASHGITDDTSDLVSGFATIGDGLSETADYPNEYWDSDEYEDDDDVGYMRQPIEDETWFLAHEIDYPSDNEKGIGHGSVPDPQESEQNKDDEDDRSFAEEDSYLSGGQCFQSKSVDPVVTNDLVVLGNKKVISESGRPCLDDICMDGDQHGSVRSIGVGINSDAADMGSEVRESLVGGSSEGDIEYFLHHDLDKKSDERSMNGKNRIKRRNPDKCVTDNDKSAHVLKKNHMDGGGFSFPPPRYGHLVQTISSKSLWSNKDNTNDCVVANDAMITSWQRKNSDSSQVRTSWEERKGMEHIKKDEDVKEAGVREEDPRGSLEDEEAAAVQEQVKQIKAHEEEFETFNLKIVHRKNRTGFEEDKSFHVVLNSVIAGRYHVTKYLGSAAFSKAIQAHDLRTGMDVCVKIIKNNKDFFYQSLDEIKLLKYVNKHDPADKYHLLRLYDYIYYRGTTLKRNLCPSQTPENILVKSYSRCEVKVIDLGSSCFETDHLCSYVQSRSYRAPEVILGLPYDKKIDIWSLGCILAELCTGDVLFQNDSPATLLARVIGIIGPIEPEMLAKGRDTYKHFTQNHMLYERNQDTNRLEYLIPKKSCLRHRLPMGDQGFIDFVGHLLETNPTKRPSASEALAHPWLQYPYEPISS